MLMIHRQKQIFWFSSRNFTRRQCCDWAAGREFK